MKKILFLIIQVCVFTSLLGQQIGSIKSYSIIGQGVNGFFASLSSNERFGTQVDTIGDLNNDGINDLVVGAPLDNDGGTQYGAVFILFMDTDKTVKSYQKISATQGNFLNHGLGYLDQFGRSVAGIGDINNDGIPDIAVSAELDRDGGSASQYTGSLRIIFLDTNGTVKSFQKISKTQGYGVGGLPISIGKKFAIDVALIGDIDSDGTNDIAVGHFHDDGGGTSKGAVWILRLLPSGKVKNYYKIQDGVANFNAPIDNLDYFGAAVCHVGDMNNDGIQDIAVGAFYDDDGYVNSGALYIINLDTNGTVKGFNKISNSSANMNNCIPANVNFGMTLSGTIDLDKNGINDLIVGAFAYSVSSSEEGAVYVLMLDSNSNVSSKHIIDKNSISNIVGGDRFGFGVTDFGDLNNDGFPEICVGAPKDDVGGTDKGSLYIISLNTIQSGMVISEKKISNTQGNFTAPLQNSNQFGWSLTNIGDINNDGVPDLATGAPFDDDGGSEKGAAYIIFMNSNGTVKSYQKISSTQGGFTGSLDYTDYFGSGISLIGDLNNDGINDIAVGAEGDDDGGSGSGAVWILFLDTNGTVKSHQKISNGNGNLASNSISSLSYFGSDISTLGDLDNDGIYDIAVGAGRNNSSKGAVFILFLNANGTVKTHQKISQGYGNFSGNLTTNNNFGICVANIGDINGDNIIDIAVGSNADDDGGSNKGAMYILFLDTNGTVKSQQKISNTQGNFTASLVSGDQFGIDIENIGLIDEDTIPDLMVGSEYDDDGGSNRGAAYILFLNSNGTVKSYQKISSTSGNFNGVLDNNDRFAHAVSIIGDLDLDGNPEVAIGASNDDDGGAEKGAIWILSIYKSFSSNITSTNNLCNGQCNGIATATVNGGTPPFTYLWSNNSTSNTISNLCAGTYTVTITDSLSQTITSSITITEPPPLIVSASGNTNICSGSCSNLMASGSGGTAPLFYMWANGLGLGQSKQVCPSTAATYTVYALDLNGCNSSADTIIVNVNPPPTVSFSGLAVSYCQNSSPALLAGTPSGGTFSGNGIFGNGFSPSIAGSGTHNIIYSYSNGNCISADTQTVIVNSLPTVNFTGLASVYCQNATTATLTGIPGGGTFSGNGISGNTFNPVTAGIGTHNIVYTYSNGICTNTDTQVVVYNPIPSISFSGLNTTYCLNDSVVTLSGIPAGGSFSGSGISGNTFNPSTAGTGNHSIIYTYSNGNCTASDTQSVFIYSLPTINFTGLNPDYCQNAIPVSLTGSPIGGTFSGNGISGNTFNPSSIIPGNTTVNYSYIDSNGCTNISSQTTTINSVPNVSISGNSNICNGSCSNLTANASGGSSPYYFLWSGGLGLGQSKQVCPTSSTTYTVNAMDINGCNSSPDSIIINVIQPSIVSFSGLNPTYCINASIANLTGIPAGGTFSGNGISANTFNPIVAGTGTHDIIYTYTNGPCTNADTQSVIVNSLPAVSFTGLDTAYCQNAAAVNLTGTPSGGTFNGNGIIGNSFIPSSVNAGYYPIVYSYTDANGCSNNQTQNTHIKASPIANAGTNISITYNSNATLFGSASGGSGFYSYSWAPADSLIFANVQNPTTKNLKSTNIFTLTATDLMNSCQSTAQVIVTVTGGPLSSFIIASPLTICSGDSSQLNAYASGGSGTYSYSWASNPSGFTSNLSNPVVAPVATTTYTVTISSGSSTNTSTAIVTVNPKPNVNISGLVSSYCINSAIVTISGSPAGGNFIGSGIYGYTFNPAVAGAGTHQIIYNYTNPLGCHNSDTQIVVVNQLPILNISGLAQSYCINSIADTLSGTPSGGTFSGTGIIGNTFNPSIAGTGYFNITYSYTDSNGCFNSVSQSTIVISSPVVNAGPDKIIPCGSAGVMIGSGSTSGFSYSWIPATGLNYSNIANPNAAPNITTLYNLTITNSSTGCSATDNVLVTVTGGPTAIVSNDTSVCSGNLANLSATGGQSYLWSTGDTTSNISVFPVYSTNYSATVTDLNGCSDADTVTIAIFPLSVVDLGNDSTIKMSKSMTLDAGSGFTSYYWNTGSTTQTHIVDGSTLGAGTFTYYVDVTDSYQCSYSDTIIITVIDDTGIDLIVNKTNISIYPNPADKLLFVKIHNHESNNVLINIINSQGKIMLSNKTEVFSDTPLIIDLLDFPVGLYFIQIHLDKFIISEKLIIY